MREEYQVAKEKWNDFAEEGLKRSPLEIKGSIDLGGHGGNLTAEITTESGTKYLFLKPKDPVEALNYKIIQKIAPEVAKFMPTVYGEVQVGGKAYLVMQNTRVSEHGNKLEQIADIKLAGKVPGLKNPIANQAEIKTTRQRKKSALTLLQMGLGARLAPDYMIALKGPKAFRLVNYGLSRSTLQKSLKGLTNHQQNELRNKLRAIQTALYRSPVALIGASIILVKDPNNGDVTPILIDPAHIEVNVDQAKVVEELRTTNDPAVFYSAKDDPEQKIETLQKSSNWNALRSLILDVSVQTTAQNILTQKPSPPQAKQGRTYSVRESKIQPPPEDEIGLLEPMEVPTEGNPYFEEKKAKPRKS